MYEAICTFKVTPHTVALKHIEVEMHSDLLNTARLLEPSFASMVGYRWIGAQYSVSVRICI